VTSNRLFWYILANSYLGHSEAEYQNGTVTVTDHVKL